MNIEICYNLRNYVKGSRIMKNIKKYIYSALMMALTFVATYAVRIPVPATEGYIHIGDSVIFVSSMLFGPVIGGITGAFGSALCDLAAGYVVYIIPTFIIKGLMGLVIGLMIGNKKNKFSNISGYAISFVILVGGYYLYESFIYSSFTVPLLSVGFNTIQYLAGAVLGTIVYKLLSKFINK